MSGHSSIGASGAHRWMNCPGSVRLCRGIQQKSSIYAATGTVAHALAEKCLIRGHDAARYLGEVSEADGFSVTIDETMVAGVQVYLDKIRADFRIHGGELKIEQKFSLEWLSPGMFGTNDASLNPRVLGGALRIYDYKNGRSAVAAENNPQCLYYSLGGLGPDNLWMVDTVICIIVQPNSWEKDPVDEWETTADDVYAWGYDVLRPAAELTRVEDAPLVPGDWCTFCPGAGICTAQAQEVFSEIKPLQNSESGLISPDQLTPEQLGRASGFFTSEAFVAWVKAITQAELDLLQRGVYIPGRKLVEKKSLGNRKWADEKAVLETPELKALGEELFNSTVKSPAQVEKILTATGMNKNEREKLLSELVTREETVKLTVVPEDDPREVFDSDAAARAVFDANN